MAKRILTVLTAVLAAVAIALAAPAQAGPDMCGGPSPYITACEGGSGPDHQNNSMTPNISEVAGVTDADGIHGVMDADATHGEWSDSVHADDVRDSALFAPTTLAG